MFCSLGLIAMALALPAAAPALDFSQYEIPRHSAASARADLSLSGDRHRSSYVDDRTSAREFRGALGLSTSWWYDSDPASREATLLLSTFGISRSSRTRDLTPFGSDPTSDVRDQMLENEQDEHSVSADFRGFLRQDVGPTPFAFRIDWAGTIEPREYTSSTILDVRLFSDTLATSRQVQRVGIDGTRVATTASGTVSFGIGKVRDVTPVYAAYLVERRLIESGALGRPLRPSSRQRLAGLMAIQPRYGVPHMRPDKFFWRDLERLLAEDGALAGSLDPYSLFRLLEPDRPGSDPRYRRQRGLFAGPSIAVLHRRLSDRSTRDHFEQQFRGDTLIVGLELEDVRQEQRFDDTDVLVGALLEAHWPLGPAWQLGARSQLLAPREQLETLTLDSSARISWVPSERWLLDGSISHRRDSGTPSAGWRLNYGASLGYLLEDRVTLSLNASESQEDRSYGHSRRFYASLGISYRFLGVLTAPDLDLGVRSL